MKTVVSFSSSEAAKLKVLLEVAREMGIDTGDAAQHLSEPVEPYKTNTAAMKIAFFARAASRKKLDVLKKVAAEMGIVLFSLSDEQTEDTLLAQDSMRTEWLAPENEHWDAFLNTHKID